MSEQGGADTPDSGKTERTKKTTRKRRRAKLGLLSCVKRGMVLSGPDDDDGRFVAGVEGDFSIRKGVVRGRETLTDFSVQSDMHCKVFPLYKEYGFVFPSEGGR